MRPDTRTDGTGAHGGRADGGRTSRTRANGTRTDVAMPSPPEEVEVVVEAGTTGRDAVKETSTDVPTRVVPTTIREGPREWGEVEVGPRGLRG